MIISPNISSHRTGLESGYSFLSILKRNSESKLFNRLKQYRNYCTLFCFAGVFFADLSWARTLLLASSAVSCVGNVYLAFILLFVLKDVCIVCMSIYAVNFALMFLNYKLYFMY